MSEEKKQRLEIIFSTAKGNSLISWIIRKVMRTPYSHVLVKVYSPIIDRHFIFEADWTKVDLKSWEEWSAENVVVENKTVSFTVERFQEIVRYCMDNVGKGYGKFTLLGILFKYLFKKPNIVGVDGERTFICSELIYRAFKTELGIVENPDFLTPKDLHKLISNMLEKK